MPRVMMIAGEASGDLHGGGVVRVLRSLLPECDVFGIGGDTMRDAGMTLQHHVRDMAFLGFAEVVRHLPHLRRVLRECAAALKSHRPDALLLIDYPGFNLKLAPIAHGLGIPVIYYISPQVWAWKASRVQQMRGVIDRMLVIFPFEVPIYEAAGIPVRFVGHPLLEEMPALDDNDHSSARLAFLETHGLRADAPLVGLFPGSRAQEIERMAHTMAAAAELVRKRMTVQFAVAAAPTVSVEVLQHAFAGSGIPVLSGETTALQRWSDAALTKSGTSTLELAVAGTPMVVMYRTSALSYRIGRAFARVNWIAMPNIVAGRQIVPEFIQHAATPERLASALFDVLANPATRATMKRDLADVCHSLGTPGAARRVAEELVNVIAKG